MQNVSGRQMRMHTGQATGALGGAVKAGENGLGLQLITAKDAIDIQAQADEAKVQTRDELNVVSANAHVDWAAKKSITVSTAGGATIKIDGGNITIQCPGKLSVNAGKKTFDQPEKISYALPVWPTSVCIECLMKARKAGAPFIVRSA
jgi:uncharacterized protein (DUF2345 family)